MEAPLPVVQAQPLAGRQHHRQLHRRIRGARAVGSIVVTSVVIGLRVLAAGSDDLEPREPERSHPTAWDSRVTSFVTFVEQHRGLQFSHPIDVSFHDEAAFIALFDVEPASVRDADRERAAQHAATLNAGGFTAQYDPIEASSTVAQVTTLGFYDPWEDAIHVRGTTLTSAVAATLVHELTHALQSQQFDVRVGGDDDLRARAVLEGDAMRIEQEYVATLGESEQEAIDGTYDADDLESELADVPWAIIDATYAPYVLGPMFVAEIAEGGGNAAVDRVFRMLPTEQELVEPERYGARRSTTAIEVAVPSGATVIDEQRSWGMFEALVLLDAWLPWTTARAPFDGWLDGRYVSYERSDGQVCFSATAEFDAIADATRFASAVSAWALAAGSSAAPAAEGTRVSFEACERGDAAPVPPRPDLSTTTAVQIERALLDLVDPTAQREDAIDRCIARTLIDDPAMVPVFAAQTLDDALQSTFAQRRDQATWDCTVAAAG